MSQLESEKVASIEEKAQSDDETTLENNYEEEDTSDPTLIEVDELANHGINVADIQKLRSAGHCTVRSIQMATRKNLIKVKGLSDMKVEKIKDAASKILDCTFMSALKYNEKRKMVVKITTGSKEFDALLGGGIQSMSITEAFGEFRTGKTQIAHTLCVTCQLPTSSGGGHGKAAYIDTEGTFRPERIREIASRFELDGDLVLENIIFARAYNSEHQMELLLELAARFIEDRTYKLLVVDSIIALFRTDFSGRGELGERQQKLNQFLSRLIKLAEEFNLAVFITNQMTSDPGATMSFVPDPKKPVGGHVLAHA
ncbi:Meiotic recombination protein dmc1, partial [Entomophthora muscae]